MPPATITLLFLLALALFGAGLALAAWHAGKWVRAKLLRSPCGSLRREFFFDAHLGCWGLGLGGVLLAVGGLASAVLTLAGL